MNIGRRIAAGCAVSLLLGACAGKSEPTTPLTALPRALTAAEQKVVSAGNDFSFSLFREVSGAQRDSNVFLSPLSASMALGMTLNGAADSTFTAMRTTLGFGASPETEINSGYRNLITLLRGLDRNTDFRIANSVWFDQMFTPLPSFLDAARTNFDAEAVALDFGAPATVTRINGWVDEHTNGKIKTIVNQIDPDMVMLLMNAIYFRGTWRHAFDPKETHDAAFTPESGPATTVRMMHQRKTLPYFETEDLQGVDLPYGNGAYSMTVLLPKSGSSVESLVGTLSLDRFNSLVAQARDREIDLDLPKFKLEYKRLMNDDLTALGMGIAFTNHANFTRISPAGGLLIGFVLQKTYLDVYEEGTEAAAVTAVGIFVTSLPSYPVMRVDRPFVLVIRERLSGTVLFVGKIARLPSA